MPFVHAQVGPAIRTGRRRVTLLIAACLAGIAPAGGCADESPLFDVPSRGAEVPAPRFTQAADSARTVVRRHMRADDLPGVSVAVGLNGELVWAEAFGWADLSSDVLATPQTLFPVGSISKSLTATAAGILWQRGRLDFDLPVQAYLPDFPEKQWPITTGQVMGHIAGLVRDGGIAETLRRERCDDARAAVAPVAEDTLLFEPGTRWQYSNFGFMLVGAVVEAAAGEPYLEFMEREVFTPAGMEQTVPDLGVEPGEAAKYDRAMFGILRRGQEIDMSCPMAAGGFLSTPSDLVRFGFAMLRREVLDSATVERFWTPQRLTSGAPTIYGYGWSIRNVALGDDEDATTRMIGHGGSVLGGQASLMILPDLDMVVAVMTNASGDVTGIASDVGGIFR